VECFDWYAWYNREPPQPYDPLLRVTAMCRGLEGNRRLHLAIGSGGVVPDPELLALDAVIDDLPSEDGTSDAQQNVRWEGDVGLGIKRVRIQGEANAELEVQFPE